ncbi:hypothetical protein ACIQF6_18900 [Kitasatospora sp. NPDC092948]|uniref:hypothetical protein n=1 Tax=Kitasatospora sp. NPDC092948 TaxID=3364088 RepID=UPI00380C5281
MSADLGDRPKPEPFDELQNVYDVLEHVRQRPGMFVRNGSLDELGLLLSGYGLALRIHGVDEQFDLDPAGPFAQWLSWTRGWPMVCGWAMAIEQNRGDEPPLEAFFRLLDEWRVGLAAASNAPAGA